MTNDKNHPQPVRTSRLSVRLADDEYALVEAAANREGLQIASFIIMLLVRVHILPEKCLRKIKRRPVPLFNELHALYGTLNLIGGNFKQLNAAMPELPNVRGTHTCLMRAADTVSDALQGKAVPQNAAPAKLDHKLTAIGYSFNDIVRSVNMGRPQLGDLPEVLAAIKQTAYLITSLISGKPINSLAPRVAQTAAAKLSDMKTAATKQTKPHKGKK